MSELPDSPVETGKTVLIVDDDSSTCLLVRNFLQKFGYSVLTAGDAAEGLSLLRQRPIDLVISDVIMPKMSGIELLEQAKELRPLLPVIIITGKPKVEAAVACIKTGAFDYMTKPLDLPRFLEHVEEALAASDRFKASANKEDQPNELLGRWGKIAGYDLRQVLGEGGLGIVFLAEKLDADDIPRKYALKIMKPEVLNASDETSKMLERFMREAKMAASISHPNVIKIYDYGLAKEEEIPYIVMEYIDGEPLSFHIMNDLLDLNQKAWVMRQAASALAAVHAAHMYHRDIKPDNILVSKDTHVTLTDFGIATSMGDRRLTTTGFLIGSPAYMSPEAYERKDTDARSDIFALGTVMYELFLGVSPFVGDTLEELSTSIRTETPPAPERLDPSLPPPIARIINRMLSKDASQRYQSARGVVAAFDEYLQPNSLLKTLVKKLVD